MELFVFPSGTVGFSKWSSWFVLVDLLFFLVVLLVFHGGANGLSYWSNFFPSRAVSLS